MIITNHMQKIIQIYPFLLKLSCKQESVTDGRYYYIPSLLSRGDNNDAKKQHFCGNMSMKLLEVSLSCLHFSLMFSEGEVKSPCFLCGEHWILQQYFI